MTRGNLTKSSLFISLLLILMGMSTGIFAEEVPFTLEDRDRLIRMETTLREFKESIDKRFEQLDKRFEQVDKRLEFIQNLMIGMLAVFGSLCGVFVGLLLWDRKTFKEKAKEEAVKAVEEGKLKVILESLREYANVEPRLKDALKKFNLL